MHTTPILRPGTSADADAIAETFTASRGLLDFLPRLHSAEEDGGFIRDHVLQHCHVTVALVDGRIAGFAAEAPGWLEHLYIAPRWLGHGLGAALLGEVKTRHAMLDLWCFRDNRRARAFYEKHGFREMERTDGRHNEERAPDIRYRWSRGRDVPRGEARHGVRPGPDQGAV